VVIQASRGARLPATRRDAAPPGREAVMAALADVPDPEIPAVSIVDLGMVGEVEVGERGIHVELLPTFVGCPALEVIRDSVEQRLGKLGTPVQVEVSFATPWTSDRISREGREKLRGSGFAPPPHVRAGRALPVLDMPASLADSAAGRAIHTGDTGRDAIACPYCGSTRTTLENLFGPTQCRSIHHCADCRQPFEAFKRI
jgi:ring-1,2-phenylacetyl-CoA epoxidase subunit PaaD